MTSRSGLWEVHNRRLALMRSLIAEWRTLDALTDGDAVQTRWGGHWSLVADRGNRVEHALVGSPLDELGELQLVRGGSKGWVLLRMKVEKGFQVPLTELQRALSDLPSRFDIDHVSMGAGPQLVGSTHTYRVPAGELWVRVRDVQARPPTAWERLGRLWRTDAAAKPTTTKPVVALGLSNEVRGGWASSLPSP